MKTKFIESGWREYKQMVVPSTASEVQIHETRQAFYAGATILFHTIMLSLDPGEEPTSDDMQRMEYLQKELDEFGQEIDLKYLTGGHG